MKKEKDLKLLTDEQLYNISLKNFTLTWFWRDFFHKNIGILKNKPKPKFKMQLIVWIRNNQHLTVRDAINNYENIIKNDYILSDKCYFTNYLKDLSKWLKNNRLSLTKNEMIDLWNNNKQNGIAKFKTEDYYVYKTKQK